MRWHQMIVEAEERKQRYKYETVEERKNRKRIEASEKRKKEEEAPRMAPFHIYKERK